jgi:hypothetical protein
MLLQANSNGQTFDTLYTSFMNDVLLQTNSYFLPLSPLLQSEYQEIFTTTLLVSPELSIVLEDYLSTYHLAASLNNLPAAVFDSYTNNLNYYPSEGVTGMFLFALYVWFLVYFFTTNLVLR